MLVADLVEPLIEVFKLYEREENEPMTLQAALERAVEFAVTDGGDEVAAQLTIDLLVNYQIFVPVFRAEGANLQAFAIDLFCNASSELITHLYPQIMTKLGKHQYAALCRDRGLPVPELRTPLFAAA